MALSPDCAGVHANWLGLAFGDYRDWSAGLADRMFRLSPNGEIAIPPGIDSRSCRISAGAGGSPNL